MELLKRAAPFALATLAIASCRPELDARSSRIDGPRVLAVRAEPAEVEPRDDQSYTVLVVDGAGVSVASPPASWAYCSIRKPLAELGSVANACFTATGDGMEPLGAGVTVAATMPNDACRQFGPEVPQPKAGEPYARPADPDPTGGYFQPVRLAIDGLPATLARARVQCGLAGAVASDVTDYRARYHPNTNPEIASLTIDGAPAGTDEATATRVAMGAKVHIGASWPVCPAFDVCGDGVCGPDESRAACPADCGGRPKGCTGAERFVQYDFATQRLVVRRESITASLLATAGSFASDRVGRDEEDSASDIADIFTAPSTAGLVRGWIVLRDVRGGVAWAPFVLDVR